MDERAARRSCPDARGEFTRQRVGVSVAEFQMKPRLTKTPMAIWSPSKTHGQTRLPLMSSSRDTLRSPLRTSVVKAWLKLGTGSK